MIRTLYPVRGCWSGMLYVSPRPRGGDWLEDEVAGWRQSGIDTVVSLLTGEEERELDIQSEADTAKKQGIRFLSCPINDREAPSAISTTFEVLHTIHRDLQEGKKVLVHCRQGIGRSGLIAASLLIRDGMEPQLAIEQVATARGIRIPETADQEEWIYQIAAKCKMNQF